MITLTRLGHEREPFQLNPDMIVTVESTPDTVVALTTGARIVVAESPEQLAAAMRAYRVEVLSEAMRGSRSTRRARPPARREGSQLSAVEDDTS